MRKIALAVAVIAAGACREAPKPEGKPAPAGLPPAEGAAKVAAGPASPHGQLPPNHPPIDPRQRMPEPADVDPTQVLEGVIDVAPELAAEVKPGDVIFLSAKAIDAATGQIVRTPIAVDRLEVAKLPMPFRLTGANVMMQGAAFKGDVAIVARIDRDRDAITRAPGDIEGTLRVTIPAKGLRLVLDTPVRP
ncbi:MAG TPA: hypothetical protein VKE22_21390 [Haliangiales bacterium]|nr:hypothetical protein [Haliangiales bacterium]